MTKIKKILIGLTTVVIPFSLFSCSDVKENKKHEDISLKLLPDYKLKTEVSQKANKIYFELSNKFDKISKVNHLSIDSRTKEIARKINQKNGQQWEFTFFDHVQKPLYVKNYNGFNSKIIKISSKEEFDNIIVKRYKDLNSVDNYTPVESDIVSEFEKRFLNSQKVSNLLETNDLYILHADEKENFSYFIIPFMSNDSLELNIIDDGSIYRVFDITVSGQLWKSFILPKKQNFKINTYFADNEFPITGSASEAKEYYDKLNKWYNEEFKKFYKD
ncbi:hypothetical protein [Mycoplasmopsis bovirhinis]|uniref:Lipoprotein n=1 Tax=Mycoplasmopsis bovirhinis TaxID=29553 RepID=A0A449ADM4_9BACT|nr:hypothetical protein [Mycoplasmopsis bovirhinis]VEU63081.1 Uncharacterised protein [Mycoplasmopsis bovirhinis]